MVNVTLPLLVRVELIFALLEPTSTLSKASVTGLSEARGVAPDPVRFSVLEPAEVLSVMVMLALCVPVVEGVKVAVMVQVSPGAKVPTQLLVSAYSDGFAPLRSSLLMISETTPLLVSVEVIAALLLPTRTLPKLMVWGVRETLG